MAGRRKNGFIMLRNRYLRLLSTLIVGGVIAGICYLVVLISGISGTYIGGALMEFALFPLGVCFVGQILGDILNEDGFLNNTQ